eukprot:14933289-Ditylum_brightwellii.AAC.1
MPLRCDTACIEVANQNNLGQVLLRTENINWQNPDVGTLHEERRKADLSEGSKRNKTMATFGKAIVQVNGAIKSKGPDVNADLIKPVRHCMGEHCSAPQCDGLDSTFSHPIFMMSANTIEGSLL